MIHGAPAVGHPISTLRASGSAELYFKVLPPTPLTILIIIHISKQEPSFSGNELYCADGIYN